MSVPMYEPLQAVPPITQQHVRMAWLLQARQVARRAMDAALAATRAAAGYVGRLVNALQLGSPLSWARRAAGHLLRPVMALGARLGRSGRCAAATAALTSPTGQAALKAAGRAVRTVGGWLARRAYSLLDRGLRCFGVPGNRAADKLFSVLVSVGGRVAEVAAPVVHRVARFSDAEAPHVRLLANLVRSYALHRALKVFVANPWLRLLVEAVLVPAVLESRLVAWLRASIRQARIRAERLAEQADAVAALPPHSRTTEQPASDAEVVSDSGDERVEVTDDIPVPSNRAERRAAERQQRRQSQH